VQMPADVRLGGVTQVFVKGKVPPASATERCRVCCRPPATAYPRVRVSPAQASGTGLAIHRRRTAPAEAPGRRLG
jgi:hypothetical protein